MQRSRHSALLRILTLVLLLRIGFDFGAHGLFVCDIVPVPGERAASRIGADDGSSPAYASAVHCFCHSISVGPVYPLTLAVLALVGSAVTPLGRAVPHTDRNPLDQPPRAAA